MLAVQMAPWEQTLHETFHQTGKACHLHWNIDQDNDVVEKQGMQQSEQNAVRDNAG